MAINRGISARSPIVLLLTVLAWVLIATAAPERAAAATDCDLTAPANVTVSTAPNQAAAVVNYPAPTTSGTCGTVFCNPPSGSSFPVGTTMVTCSATTSPPVDASFLIRVNDTQAPNLTVPPDISVGNDPRQDSARVAFAPPSATDNVPGVFAFCSAQSGSIFPLGVTAITCFARDAAGNSTFKGFSVTVRDTEAPDTLLLSGPPKKTTKRMATFRFTAGGPAGFECQLDKAAFKPCAGSATYKVKLGKHTFTVRAIDGAGNADATPATRVWIVRKR